MERETSGEVAWMLLERAAKHPVSAQGREAADATDEEIQDFIRIFMRPASRYNHDMTSYGLKHACERAVGYIFHGSDWYNYVSNADFKRIMREKFAWEFEGKADDPNGVNMVYKFKWAPGALDVLYAFGVYGSKHHKPLRQLAKEKPNEL